MSLGTTQLYYRKFVESIQEGNSKNQYIMQFGEIQNMMYSHSTCE